jgi:hypothetical protein
LAGGRYRGGDVCVGHDVNKFLDAVPCHQVGGANIAGELCGDAVHALDPNQVSIVVVR